jgi:asparagine synthase (glutamine-hydrolysing)
VFGSEIRPVIATDGAPPDVDPAALNLFLKYRYTPSPLTIFEGIRKLAPGTMLVVENGRCSERRWYDYTPVPFDESVSDREAEEELLRLYRGAVKRHLLSDVPVGLLLSGGLDSGCCSPSCASTATSGRPTPSATASRSTTTSSRPPRRARRCWGGRHVPVMLEPQGIRAVAAHDRGLPRGADCVVVRRADVLRLSAAREDVKVVMIGQGPDELFCGYRRHRGLHYGESWRRLPGPLRGVLSAAVRRLPATRRRNGRLCARHRGSARSAMSTSSPSRPRIGFDGLFHGGLLPASNGRFGVGARCGRRWPTSTIWRPSSTSSCGRRCRRELLMFADKLSMGARPRGPGAVSRIEPSSNSPSGWIAAEDPRAQASGCTAASASGSAAAGDAP